MPEHAGYVLETLSHVHETPHAELWSTLRERSTKLSWLLTVVKRSEKSSDSDRTRSCKQSH